MMTTLALSEAIRLGAMLRPQCFEQMFRWKRGRRGKVAEPVASCAIGAAIDAVTDLGGHVEFAIGATWPIVGQSADCPVCGLDDSLTAIIVHLNDEHRWTREAIADHVALIEARDPHQPTSELVVCVP